MRIPYLVPGLAVFFLAAVIGLFVWQSSEEAIPSAQISGSTSGQGASAPVLGNRPVASTTRQAPFLTSHESEVVVIPSGENVAASFHMEMEILKQRLESAPQDTTSLFQIARLKQDAHQLEEAVEYYRRYLDLVPVGRQARLDLTRCYGDLGLWNEALTLSEESLGLLPDDPGILYNQGAIFANIGNYDEARRVWQDVAKQEKDAEMQSRAQTALSRLDLISE